MFQITLILSLAIFDLFPFVTYSEANLQEYHLVHVQKVVAHW
jgi:hypothetical protein